ncbi:unnamed protein product [Diatraea saccharalis]|uniref:Uncharacterized protein n=1 Tax=Diatraea saccharalis TaxID=40085 RepID=A0A9N9QWQ8_9NEOP|nr:unnamed protein product [Diatraea saccharalis]
MFEDRDTEKSQTNYRLKLQPEYVLKKSWFMQIPKLPYCSMSGAMLRVCDPSGQRPLLVNFDSSGAIVVRKADDLTLPAVSNLAVFCRFED